MSICRNPTAAALVAAITGAATIVGSADGLAAEPDEGIPPSLYRISPVGDGLIITAGALGAAIPYLLRGHIVDARCPCDRNEVNGFDRGTIGNDNVGLYVAANVTLGLTLLGPLALDIVAVQDRRVVLEDAVVFTEAVTTNLVLVTTVKLIVQRPEPRVYEPRNATDVGRKRFYLS